jgi:hypothetical protein
MKNVVVHKQNGRLLLQVKDKGVHVTIIDLDEEPPRRQDWEPQVVLDSTTTTKGTLLAFMEEGR